MIIKIINRDADRREQFGDEERKPYTFHVEQQRHDYESRNEKKQASQQGENYSRAHFLHALEIADGREIEDEKDES